MTNLEQELINEVNKNKKEFKEKALKVLSNNRYVAVQFTHKKVQHEVIYDRQIGSFIKILYLTKFKGLTRANEIIL